MSVGINETKELLIAVDEVALLLVKNMKLGVFADVLALVQALQSDEDFKAKLAAAWDKRQEIPAEIGDLSIPEVMELGVVELGYVPKFIAAIVG